MKRHPLNGNAENTRHGVIRLCNKAVHYLEPFWLLAALGSVVLLFAESAMPVIPLRGYSLLSYQSGEYLFTFIFSAEYILRLSGSQHRIRYIFSFFGVIDLITLLPLYVLWLWPEIAVEYLTVMRLLRVLRLLRVVKVLRYFDSASLIWETLYSARRKLLLFLGMVMILLCLSGGMMYVIEGPEHGFTTLLVSVYWAVVTMTTVGYGDITPHTTVGRMLASLLILTGYSMIAIPTGVMSAYMTEIMQRRRRHRSCPSCQNTEHIDDARFCQRCGASLDNNDAQH
ncbi:potassium channel family protein [Citrobacter sp. ESBL3]|uniref:potassium channel family protein n=1 Tax=Citrobacter sp. ESBL3 TaxID=3077326 RepID=UPI002FC7512B